MEPPHGHISLAVRAHKFGELVTPPPTETSHGVERKEGSRECGELTYGYGMGYELDVCLAAGKKSLEKSDLRIRGAYGHGGDRTRPQLPRARPPARFFCPPGFRA